MGVYDFQRFWQCEMRENEELLKLDEWFYR